MTMQSISMHPAEAALFDNLLSHEARLPAAFVPGESAGRLSQAESLLRSLALIEDHSRKGRQSANDDESPFEQRLESKLDLNLLLLGRLLEHVSAPLPTRAVRWSIRGARLESPDVTNLPKGSEGVLQIQPCQWLPESLELPASILADAPGQWLWLSFPAFTPRLSDALERHLFRQHRRQIALARSASGCR